MELGKGESNDPAAAEEPVSPITFRLDPSSGVPTYLQLVHQVEQALRIGYLKLGDQLPRVKDAVATLSINPNTVLKAYRELEHLGIAVGRPGQGTFIAAVPQTLALRDLARLRKRLLTGWLREAVDTGLDEAAIAALFASTLSEMSRSAAGRDGAGGTVRKGAAAS
jgi:GntR family transcriptional regulator